MTAEKWDGKERRKDYMANQQEIFDRINALERQQIILTSAVENNGEVMKESMKMMRTLIQKHDNTLYGDGTQHQVGHGERLNRLEKSEDSRNKHMMVVWTALVGGFIKMILDVFTIKH